MSNIPPNLNKLRRAIVDIGQPFAWWPFDDDCIASYGTKLGAWFDDSPSNLVFQQTTTSKWPTASSGGASFVAASSTSLSAGTADTICPAAWEAWTDFQLSSTPAGGTAMRLWNTRQAAGQTNLVGFINIALYQPYTFQAKSSVAAANAVGITDALDTNRHLLAVSYDDGTITDPASYLCWLDNVSKTVTTSSASGTTSGENSVGARVTEGDSYLDGTIYEHVVYNRQLSAGERTALSSWFATHTGASPLDIAVAGGDATDLVIWLAPNEQAREIATCEDLTARRTMTFAANNKPLHCIANGAWTGFARDRMRPSAQMKIASSNGTNTDGFLSGESGASFITVAKQDNSVDGTVQWSYADPGSLGYNTADGAYTAVITTLQQNTIKGTSAQYNQHQTDAAYPETYGVAVMRQQFPAQWAAAYPIRWNGSDLASTRISAPDVSGHTYGNWTMYLGPWAAGGAASGFYVSDLLVCPFPSVGTDALDLVQECLAALRGI